VNKKILFIADYGPPYNRIGAVRVGRTIKYLRKMGYDIRLLTAHHDLEVDLSLPLELPLSSVFYADSPRFSEAIDQNYINGSAFIKIWKRFWLAIKNKNIYFLFREDSLSWIPIAERVGQKIVADWMPDIIISSALPISAHVVAGRLSRRYKIFWIAEYRDLWLRKENPKRINKWFDRTHEVFERLIIRNAKLLVTVSEPLADYLRARTSIKVKTIYSGFDAVQKNNLNTASGSSKDKLMIAYTGSVYLTGRSICDPLPLLKAISLLGTLRYNLCINIYTDKNPELEKLILDLKVDDVIKVNDRVSYQKSNEIQNNADILLFFGYSSKIGSENGILSGKVLEYVSAMKPILSIGKDVNHILCQEGIMENFHAPEDIAQKLGDWIKQKRSDGYVATPYTEEQIGKWSAEYQVARLNEEILAIHPCRSTR
jgi:glycosyltransferase involved in cell wall biosynthesis